MKLKPLLISLAAVSALAAGAANAAQVIVTTGAGYVKMVDALAALYQKETGVAVEKSFGGKWLKATGLDAKVAPKLQVVGTVPQVYSYVTTGNMDAGFVNLAVLKSGTEALGGHAAIRDESAVVHMTVRPVRGAEADADVKAFMDFLASEKAKPVLRKFGIE